MQAAYNQHVDSSLPAQPPINKGLLRLSVSCFYGVYNNFVL